MWITLHDYHQQEIHINMDNMESMGVITVDNYRESEEWREAHPDYEPVSYKGRTYIVPCGLMEDEECYVVQETPGEIRDKMNLWKAANSIVL